MCANSSGTLRCTVTTRHSPVESHHHAVLPLLPGARDRAPRPELPHSYRSNIPHGVGMAGSSAIITAGLRAMMDFYGVVIPKPVQAGLILSAENDELKIQPGFRTASPRSIRGSSTWTSTRRSWTSAATGTTRRWIPGCFHPCTSPTGTTCPKDRGLHNNIRDRFERGERAVVNAMRFWASLTDQLKDCLLKGHEDQIGPLINANFDRAGRSTRSARRIYGWSRPPLGRSQRHFTGSGGDHRHVPRPEDVRPFEERAGQAEDRVIKPRIAEACSIRGDIT